MNGYQSAEARASAWLARLKAVGRVLQVVYWGAAVGLIGAMFPGIYGLTWADYRTSDGVTLTVFLGVATLSTGVASRVMLIAAAGIERLRSEYQARHDDLTGLFNRRHFYDELERHVAGVDQEAGSVALVLLDVDRMKSVNDTHGHLAGDHLLRQVAGRLTAACNGHCVARIGGDEFAIIACGASEPEAREIAGRAVEAVRSTPCPIDGAGSLEASICAGVAMASRTNPLTVDQLFATADDRLYQSKRARGWGERAA